MYFCLSAVPFPILYFEHFLCSFHPLSCNCHCISLAPAHFSLFDFPLLASFPLSLLCSVSLLTCSLWSCVTTGITRTNPLPPQWGWVAPISAAVPKTTHSQPITVPSHCLLCQRKGNVTRSFLSSLAGRKVISTQNSFRFHNCHTLSYFSVGWFLQFRFTVSRCYHRMKTSQVLLKMRL